MIYFARLTISALSHEQRLPKVFEAYNMPKWWGFYRNMGRQSRNRVLYFLGNGLACKHALSSLVYIVSIVLASSPSMVSIVLGASFAKCRIAVDSQMRSGENMGA